MALPMGSQGKGGERSVGNLEPSWGPQVPHKCCEENRENAHGSVFGLIVCLDFDEQAAILEVLAPLCTALAQGLSNKNHFDAQGVTHLGIIF